VRDRAPRQGRQDSPREVYDELRVRHR
jgi:hypothetical protein